PELEEAKISKVEASSFQYPNFPYNILDGNIGTMWAANGTDQWLLLHLKEPFNVDHVKLAFQTGLMSESYFDILGSLDNENWEPILIKSSSCGYSGNLQVFNFPVSKTETEYSFIKLIGHSNSVNTWNYISEFKLFGYSQRSVERKEQSQITIYPNPVNEYINISIREQALIPDFVRIINFSGKIVFEDRIDPDVKELQIPVNFVNGIYIIQMGSEYLTFFTQKVIVSK
ncbi:MAG: discoidin domain-containing protein, partial [Bacteroidales bacterium]|nr:discoidin domain-containing protein [Bacteroidales bacterium]